MSFYKNYLNENINDLAYFIDIRKLNIDIDVEDLIDELFDEYKIDAELTNNKNIIKVYLFNDKMINKFADMMYRYNVDDDYLSEVLDNPGENINESKKIYNRYMKHSLNESVLMKRRMLESLDRQPRNYRTLDESLDFEVDMNGHFDPIFEADDCNCKYKNRLISKMDKGEKRDAKNELRAEIKDLKNELKARAKSGKSVKALEVRLEKLEKTLDCLMGRCEKEDKPVKESVTSAFAKYRKMFEAEESEDETKNTEDEPANEEPENEPVDDTNTDDNEYEDIDMKAVVLTVLCKNVEEVKNAMVEAGVAEDDITLPETDDCEDDDKVEIKVDVKSIDALKSYLEGVGIDIEKELDGEIVSNTEDTETPEDSAKDAPVEDEPTEEDFDDLFAE